MVDIIIMQTVFFQNYNSIQIHNFFLSSYQYFSYIRKQLCRGRRPQYGRSIATCYRCWNS